MITSEEYGENAKTFPILLIEEPEAHLHPALQYNFLKFLKEEVKNQTFSRQIFITTHSTHITSAVGLKPIICLEKDESGKIFAKYPDKVFSESNEDQESKKYVERYLDATKSAMLFAKSVILVEGMAELLLIPVLAELIGCDLDRHHVSLVRVDSLTFKHFIKLYGAGVDSERQKYALQKRVACIIDSDPAKLEKRNDKKRWIECWPFEINQDPENYEYREVSGAVKNLLEQKNNSLNVEIFYKKERGKTFEYDLAWDNYQSKLLITDEVEIVEVDELKASNWVNEDKERAKYASSFLLHAKGRKGELAFELASRIQENKDEKLILPDHIRKALEWVCYKDNQGVGQDGQY